VVTVESATFNSITPRVQNNNNRMVRAFGRFFPTNLSDLGLITSGSSNIGLTYSDDFLQANRQRIAQRKQGLFKPHYTPHH